MATALAPPKRRADTGVLLPADVWSVIKHFFFRDLWQARFARHVVPTIPRPVFLRTKPGYRYCVIRDADYSCWKMRQMFTDVEAVCVGTQDVFRVHDLPTQL